MRQPTWASWWRTQAWIAAGLILSTAAGVGAWRASDPLWGFLCTAFVAQVWGSALGWWEGYHAREDVPR